VQLERACLFGKELSLTITMVRSPAASLTKRERASVITVGGKISTMYMPTFVSWVHLLPASSEIMAWLDRIAETTDSEYLISSQARDLMERITPSLEIVGLILPPGRALAGAAYLPAFADTVESLLAAMNVEQPSGGR
jgi:hypothetical protein